MRENPETTFAQRLVMARNHAGLTQEDLAKKVGMAQGTLAEAESKGKRSGYTAQLAQVCGVSPLWLAKGEGTMVDTPLTGAAHTVSSATATLGPSPALQAGSGQITAAMKTLFEAVTQLQGFAKSQAQNALRYATENPLEWQAAALTLEQLLASIGSDSGSPPNTGSAAAPSPATGRGKFTKKPAHSFLPTKDQGKGAKER